MKIEWNELDVKLIGGGRVRCEPGWKLDISWSKRLIDFDLWFVWAGRGLMQTHQGQVLLRPGIAIWARPGGVYLADQNPENRLGVSFMHFELRQKDGGLRSYDAPLPPLVHDLIDVNYVDAIMRRVADLILDKNPAKKVIATQLITALLMDLDNNADCSEAQRSGTQRHHQEIVLRLASKIRESPNEIQPIAELASASGYSADHFSRIFKNVLGQSPQEFTLLARIDRARQLLLETALSIGEIASALGYQDVFFFSKQFKQKTGVTPTGYRKMESPR